MRTLLLALCFALLSVAALAFVSVSSDASSIKTLPNFELKGLDESEHRLSDARFKDKVILLVAFSTWQDVSIRQAREIQAFHVKRPNVEIVALIADDLALARDFVANEKLTFPCYKSGDGPRAGQNLNRLFDTKKNKTFQLNKLPFVVLCTADRKVAFAQVGLTSEATLSEQLAAIP